MITHHASRGRVRLTVSLCHHVCGITHDPASQTHDGRHVTRWASYDNVSILSRGPVIRDCYVSLIYLNSDGSRRGVTSSCSNLQQPLSSKLYWDKIVNVQNGQLSSHSNILIFKQFNWQTNCKRWYAFFSRDWWELIENWSEILEQSRYKSVSM